MKKHIEKLKESLEKVKSQEVKMNARPDFESAICGDCYDRLKRQGYGVREGETVCQGYRRLLQEQERFKIRCLGKKGTSDKPAPDCVDAYKQFKIFAETECNANSSSPYCRCIGPNANLCETSCKTALEGYFGATCPGCKNLFTRMYCPNQGIIKDCDAILRSRDCCGR